MAGENRHKHLEFLQLTIIRMAANSFLLKAWCVTLVAALFALAAKDSISSYILIAYIPVAVFWILDGYYLRQERLFRKLYDRVRKKREREIDFSMDTSPVKDQVSKWLRCIFTVTLVLFYVPILGVITVVSYIVLVRS